MGEKFINGHIGRASLGLALFLIMSLSVMGQSVKSIPDTISAKTSATVEKKSHNPNTALILSAVLPGAGQVYNHQVWKIPIVYAALGGVGYYSWYNYSNMSQLKKEYLYRVNNDDAILNEDYTQYPTANIYNMYQSYNKTFQLSIIIGVAVYGLNLLDAYISAHLFDFEMSDDITLNISPTITSQPIIGPTNIMGQLPTPAMGLTLKF